MKNSYNQKKLQGTSVLPAACINSLSPFPLLRVHDRFVFIPSQSHFLTVFFYLYAISCQFINKALHDYFLLLFFSLACGLRVPVAEIVVGDQANHNTDHDAAPGENT